MAEPRLYPKMLYRGADWPASEQIVIDAADQLPAKLADGWREGPFATPNDAVVTKPALIESALADTAGEASASSSAESGALPSGATPPPAAVPARFRITRKRR